MISIGFGLANDKTFFFIKCCGGDIYFRQFFNETRRYEKYQFF
jgi:hypothetical protein